MKRLHIVYANTIDWDNPNELQQRPHWLMQRLSERGHKVSWINKTKNEGLLPTKINPNLTIYHNWDVFIKRNHEVDIYFSSWSYRHLDLQYIKPKVGVVYDSLDNFQQNEHQEEKMVSCADIILTTSQPLYDLRNKQHKNVYICRNGCNFELTNIKQECPKDLLQYKNNNKPIILFSGALAHAWIDLELVEKIASKYQLIVVGLPWGLRQMPRGVVYLGKKNYKELQGYYQYCDVNILPFSYNNQIAIYSNPIKCVEALAAGKQTIATSIPEAYIYPDMVLPSKTHDEFIHNIEFALRRKDDINLINKCKKTAEQEDWDCRVDIIENAIIKFCEEKGISI